MTQLNSTAQHGDRTASSIRWAGGLLGLHALTSLHPGAGTALGTVDLPVQRERHTDWPNIAGSAQKGILRDLLREQRKGNHQDDPDEAHAESVVPPRTRRRKANEEEDDITTIFGPVNSEHAGAISITDARLLAYPVRSLKGIFAWVTCPGVIERLQRDSSLLHESLPASLDFGQLQQGQESPAFKAITPEPCPCLIDSNGSRSLLLEEHRLEKVTGDSKPLAEWIAERLFPTGDHYRATRDRFVKQFIVVTDNDFTYFVRHCTEISARIALDYDTKTVTGGALFYQEFLPTESLFYSVVLMNEARTRGKSRSGGARELIAVLEKSLQTAEVLQIGGDETTGKGYCSARLYTNASEHVEGAAS